MIELEAPDRKTPRPAIGRTSRPSGRGAFRRRSATHVLLISGFVLFTVWGLRYLGEASEVFHFAAEGGRGQPWDQVLDPLFIAKTVLRRSRS